MRLVHRDEYVETIALCVKYLKGPTRADSREELKEWLDQKKKFIAKLEALLQEYEAT